MDSELTDVRPPASRTALFVGFFLVGICGFGGVLPWARRMVVEQRRWMTGPDFTDLLALCQFLPGPNVINVSVAIGARFWGAGGAGAAFAGLMAAPMVIVILLGMVYARYANVPAVQHLFIGLAAAASGLVLATSLKIAAPLRTSPIGIALAVIAFAAVAVLRLPLLPTLLVMAPVSIAIAWRVAPAMSQAGTLGTLAALYAELSLLAVGGGNTILPEMQRRVVDVQGWMTGPQFAALYALAQASPGPNMLVSTLVGWRVAGLPGALVATMSLCAPSCLLTYFTADAWYRFRHAVWRKKVQWGLVPMTVGLLMAGAAVLCEATVVNWQTAAVTVGVTGAMLFTKVNPLWLMAAGAGLGVLGWL